MMDLLKSISQKVSRKLLFGPFRPGLETKTNPKVCRTKSVEGVILHTIFTKISRKKSFPTDEVAEKHKEHEYTTAFNHKHSTAEEVVDAAGEELE